MVAADKIEQAKDCFDTITKSGRNNYQKYDYLETKDIFPLVRKICRKFNLRTQIKPNLENNCFILTITDKDDNSSEQFFVPYAQITAGDAGKFMQDFGRCQTYAMKYLYIQAFEITVPDEIDNKDQNKQSKKNMQKINNNNDKGNFQIPDNADETTKAILTKIQKDFGNRVKFTNNTLRNKLHSMEKIGQIDETQIENVVKTLLEMGYKI